MSNKNRPQQISQMDPGGVLKNTHDFDGQNLRVRDTVSVVQDYYTHSRVEYNVDSKPTKVTYLRGTSPQETEVGVLADSSGSLNNTYFLIYDATSDKQYYVWYNVSGGGTDPLVANSIGIEVPINTNDPAAIVALATKLAINTESRVFSAIEKNSVVTILTQKNGQTTTSVDFSTGFTITTKLGTEVVVEEVLLDYSVDGNPIYEGQELIGHALNIATGKFEVSSSSSITGVVGIINSLDERVETTDDLLDSNKKRFDVNNGTETLNSDGNIAHRVIITQPSPTDQPGPSDIELSSTQVFEGSSIGTFIANITSINGLAPFTFTITDDPDGVFQINGNDLEVGGVLDFAIANQHNVTIQVEDANNKTFEKTFLISVLESAEAIDKKVSFNGIDETIFHPNIVELNGVANLAFSIGFIVTRNRQGVFEKVFSRQATGGNKRGIEISFDTSNFLHFKLINNENNSELIDVRVNNAQQANQTFFYVWTYNGNQTASGIGVRRNGGAIGTTTVSDTLPFNSNLGSNEAHWGSSSNLNEPLQGSINNIMLFNRELTNGEINEIWNGGDPLEDLSSISFANAVVQHVPINNLDVYPTLVDQFGNYNLTMNANMSQSNIVDA